MGRTAADNSGCLFYPAGEQQTGGIYIIRIIQTASVTRKPRWREWKLRPVHFTSAYPRVQILGVRCRHDLITSVEEVLLSPGPFVCQEDYTKATEWISTKAD